MAFDTPSAAGSPLAGGGGGELWDVVTPRGLGNSGAAFRETP